MCVRFTGGGRGSWVGSPFLFCTFSVFVFILFFLGKSFTTTCSALTFVTCPQPNGWKVSFPWGSFGYVSAGVRGPCRKTWKWAQTHAALVTSSGTFFSCSLHQLERMKMILALMQNRIFNWNIILMKNIITASENCPRPVCLFVGLPLSTSMTNLKRARDSDKKINESAFVWPATRARKRSNMCCVYVTCHAPFPLLPLRLTACWTCTFHWHSNWIFAEVFASHICDSIGIARGHKHW